MKRFTMCTCVGLEMGRLYDMTKAGRCIFPLIPSIAHFPSQCYVHGLALPSSHELRPMMLSGRGMLLRYGLSLALMPLLSLVLTRRLSGLLRPTSAADL